MSQGFLDGAVGIVAGVAGVALLTASAVHLREPVLPARTAGAAIVSFAIPAPNVSADTTATAKLVSAPAMSGLKNPRSAGRKIVGRSDVVSTRPRASSSKGSILAQHHVLAPVARLASRPGSTTPIPGAHSGTRPASHEILHAATGRPIALPAIRRPGSISIALASPRRGSAAASHVSVVASHRSTMRTNPRIVDPDATPEPPIGYNTDVENAVPIDLATPQAVFSAGDLPNIAETKRRRR